MQAWSLDQMHESRAKYLTASKRNFLIVGSGEINFEEFVQLMVKQMKQASESDVMEAFREWDIDSSGSISTKELRSMLMRSPETLTRQEVDAMLEAVDTRGSGKIRFESE